MISGIYSIYWEIPDLIYIGQSSNLPIRLKEHLRLFNNNKASSKRLLEAYRKYGRPVISVLEYCDIDKLDQIEQQYIIEFDSMVNGLNAVPGGFGSGADTKHAASKYSKEEILNACKLLTDYTISQKEISKITGISEPVLSTILNDTRHTWLRTEYPEIRKILDNSRKERYEYNKHNSKYKNYFIQSPKGDIYQIINVSTFAKEYKLLHTKLNEVLKGKRKHHCGWKLPTEMKEENVKH